ncbi:hypothetical protein N2W29_001450 [Clostridium perfringens]|nr:hypothetical protein [Clostridium perfringens]WEV17027.1 hypothetical protein PL325_05400 [Clostridium perfringens D]
MFIDASNKFKKGKNQNILRDRDLDKYTYVATMEEIKETKKLEELKQCKKGLLQQMFV